MCVCVCVCVCVCWGWGFSKEGTVWVTMSGSRISTSKYALQIDPVWQSDEGRYSCHAANEHGQKWANFTLTVEGQFPPRFSSPLSVSLGVGGWGWGVLFFEQKQWGPPSFGEGGGWGQKSST